MKTQNMILALALFLVLTLSPVLAISDEIYLDDYTIGYSYSGAEEDETFSLSVTINNSGAVKEEVIFEFDEKSPFDISNNYQTWEIGVLGENEQVTRSFRIDVDEGADSGEYKLPFTLDDSEDDYDDDFEISVNSFEADLIVGDIVSSPLVIMADQKDVKLELTIQNIGDSDAEFVLATLNLPAGFEKSDSYSDFANLGTIAAGESKTAIFFIDTMKNVPTENTASIGLEYKSDSDKKTDSLNFNIPVKGKPSFEIVSSGISPRKVSAGDGGKLELAIQNIGDKVGEETSVRIFENTDIPIEFSEKTKYIGDLNINEIGRAVFDFDVKSSADVSSYLVKIQVRTVSGDSVLTEEYNVPIVVSKDEGSSVNTLIYVALGVLVVLIFVLIWVLRKR